MPFPYAPFVGSIIPVIPEAAVRALHRRQGAECTAENFAPIGTGPFKVEEFRPNDVVRYVANDRYRHPDQPVFSRGPDEGRGRRRLGRPRGAGDRRVRLCWNLQVAPEILADREQAGRGEVLSAFGTFVERLVVNMTNPDPAVGDTRSTYQDGANPHPFLSIP